MTFPFSGFSNKSIMMININCLPSMVSHRRGEFVAQYRTSSSPSPTSHTFFGTFSFSPAEQHGAIYTRKNLENVDKIACLALCLQSPTETDVFMDLSHVWKETKARQEWQASVPFVTSLADVQSRACCSAAKQAKEVKDGLVLFSVGFNVTQKLI